MSINPKLNRWVVSSIYKHFKTSCPTLDIYFEGMPRDNFTDKEAFVEVRVDGPRFTELNKDYWRVYFEVNVLLQATITDDIYVIDDMIGTVLAAFTTIIVSKNNDGGAVIGCTDLVKDYRSRERIQVYKLGRIAPDEPLMQAVVEGHYSTEWTTSQWN